MDYLLGQGTAKKTSQRETIPGREKDMMKNAAGGFVFTADSFTRLKRFLILGSEGGTYYVSEHDLTKQNVDNVRACLENKGLETVAIIREISMSGRAPKNDPALYALALAASYGGDEKVRHYALSALPDVARTGTHLFQFVAYIDSMRGWAIGLRKAIANWYQSKTPVEKLGYQLVKYQQRGGWSHRDLFRLAHVPTHNEAIYRWLMDREHLATERVIPAMSKKNQKERRYNSPAASELPPIIDAFEAAKGASEDVVIALIRKHGLTREMIPTEVQKSPAVWEALFEKMPMMAMVRTLGRMSASGFLAPLSDASKEVVSRLSDAEKIRKARVHPIQFLSALLTYKQGHGQKGKLKWTPVGPVVDALNDAFYKAFDFVDPTNKRFYLGIDVSASMTSGQVAGIDGLTPNMGAAAMAMLIARTEPNHFIGGFSHHFVDLGVTRTDRLDQAMRKCQRGFGGTDCAIAIKHALEENYPVDAFVVVTDGETWAGNIHASQAIQQYRQKTGIDSKLIVINMVANRTSLTDSTDAGSLDVIGFDASVPTIINQFLGKAETTVESEED